MLIRMHKSTFQANIYKIGFIPCKLSCQSATLVITGLNDMWTERTQAIPGTWKSLLQAINKRKCTGLILGMSSLF